MKRFFSTALLLSLSACATLSERDRQKISVDETIKSNQLKFLHCFESENKKPQGKLLIWFIIDVDGTVKAVNLKESTLDNPAIEHCMMKEIMEMQFQRDLSDQKIEMTYPFKFTRE